MSKLVLFITARIEESHQIGEAWKAAGAPGVTFIESYGLRRLQEAGRSFEVLPGMLSILQILRDNEQTSVIILSLLPEAALVEQLIQATERILGDLTLPNNGVLLVIDVERAVGLHDHQ